MSISYIVRFINGGEEWFSVVVDEDNEANFKNGLIKTGDNRLFDDEDTVILTSKLDLDGIAHLLDVCMSDSNGGRDHILMNTRLVNKNDRIADVHVSILVYLTIGALEILETLLGKPNINIDELINAIDDGDDEVIDMVYSLVNTIAALDALEVLDEMIKYYPMLMKYEETIKTVREHWRELYDKIM